MQITQSDVISFHHYGDLDALKKVTQSLQQYGKPVVCTEYMARGAESFFDPNLGYLHDEEISAFNWGFVSGRTQTIYAWNSWDVPNPYEGVSDPEPWFHDIFYEDGTPKYPDEIEYIKLVTGAERA